MLLNENSKPTIIIHVNRNFNDKNVINQICNGIEEEGIPYEIVLLDGRDDHIKMAFDACQNSRLGVGIGVSGDNIALHYEKLNEKQPLFNMSIHEDMNKIRALGANGARLVKRMPFKMLHD